MFSLLCAHKEVAYSAQYVLYLMAGFILTLAVA